MARVKRGVAGRKKRKKIMRLAKGFFGARRRTYRLATESVNRALAFAFRDRKARKREFRSLWIARINAAARLENLAVLRTLVGRSARSPIWTSTASRTCALPLMRRALC